MPPSLRLWQCTLCIKSHFLFRINYKPGSDGATSDGTFIQRNHVYTVNVTLKRLGGGSAICKCWLILSLTVTVEPQEWRWSSRT